MKPDYSLKTQGGSSIPIEKDPLKSLLDLLARNNPELDPARILKAFEYLKESTPVTKEDKHAVSIEDALETAQILAELHADEETIIVALVENLTAQGYRTADQVREQFGDEVGSLVKNVARTSQIRFKKRIEEQAENFRKMILSMAQDLRVVLLNLAKRLQVMRRIGRFDETTQNEIAQETLEIYAPLANRLGIALIKSEMEDLCLKVLHPSVYKELEERVPQDRKERSAYIDKVTDMVKKEMAAQGIPGEIDGRHKHFYSIYQKILKRGLSFDDLFDLIALRIITDTNTRCYAILGMIHSMWKPIPGRFKDYIGVPKSNMYQSLHTTVMGPDGQNVEFQIRTQEMHRIAEAGIAAHWKYKEGIKTSISTEHKFAWLRQLLEWQQELKSPREFMESVKTDLFEESVYVFTPTGDIKELSSGSTPLDFAYSIHSDVGNHCTGAKVNNRIVSLKTALKTGDTVEILTSKNQTPSKDWLKLVKTTKARNRISHFLTQEEQNRSLSLGHEILEREARKHGLVLSRVLKSAEIQKAASDLGFAQLEKMINAVGFGKLSAKQILNRILPEAAPEPIPVKPRKTGKIHIDGIKIHGIGDILVHFSKCCNPVPGDEIIGFITRGKGVSIHKMDCFNVGGGAVHSERIVEVEWDLKEERIHQVRISVLTTNRPGILANISARISSENVNISAADIRTRKDGRSICIFELEIRNRQDLDRILHAISQVKEVLEVKRMTES
ncbi:MAG: bifunctional (p)ppGpp synthetase/guanosine-3',5'-bis(diphosphate) 3'-pyrophosphohydrolase [bacterium]